jgi:hypothetical protein
VSAANYNVFASADARWGKSNSSANPAMLKPSLQAAGGGQAQQVVQAVVG